MKVSITVDMPMPSKEKTASAKPAPSLKERVEYAICQIECRSPLKNDSIVFLRKVLSMLEKKGRLSEEEAAIKDSIKPAIQDYGSYHSGSDQE